jgi:cytochrome c oxidase cbb3-type subunit 1
MSSGHGASAAPAPAAAAPAGAQPLVDTKLVFAWFAVSLCWTVVGPALGLIAALKLDDPNFLAEIDWLQTARVRTAHVLGVIFGVFTPAMFGFMCYAVPKLTGRPLTSVKAGWVGFWLVTVGVLLGEHDVLRGNIQGIEAAEYGRIADLCITGGFVTLTAMFLHTVALRKERRLYVSLWYWVASLLWTCMNFVLGNFILDRTVTGASSAAMNGFYLHNVVGLWITPAGLGVAYYVLPAAAKARLYSHRLSLIGFWGLALIHHYIYSPIAEWAQTIAIAASMMLIVPVWAFSVNVWGTMKGQWSKLSGSSYALKFTIFGAVWYLITCFQGPTEALRGVQALTHFGDYNVGHAHSAVYAVFVIWGMAAIYFTVPRLLGRDLWSNRLGAWHYWLQILGFGIMFAVLTVDGLVQGAMLSTAGVEFIDTVVAIKPYWLIRTLGGTMMDVGLALFVFNMVMTVIAGRPSAAPAPVPASAPAKA